MSTNHIQIAASPHEVFAALANPANFGRWLVGSDDVRDAEPSWPKLGSRFHHRVGFGLLKVNDHTEVLEVDPPHLLVMHAHARPFGSAEISLRLAERDAGTHLTMTETAGDRLSQVALNQFTDPILHLRNAESLRRLKRIAETRIARP